MWGWSGSFASLRRCSASGLRAVALAFGPSPRSHQPSAGAGPSVTCYAGASGRPSQPPAFGRRRLLRAFAPASPRSSPSGRSKLRIARFSPSLVLRPSELRTARSSQLRPRALQVGKISRSPPTITYEIRHLVPLSINTVTYFLLRTIIFIGDRRRIRHSRRLAGPLRAMLRCSSSTYFSVNKPRRRALPHAKMPRPYVRLFMDRGT